MYYCFYYKAKRQTVFVTFDLHINNRQEKQLNIQQAENRGCIVYSESKVNNAKCNVYSTYDSTDNKSGDICLLQLSHHTVLVTIDALTVISQQP